MLTSARIASATASASAAVDFGCCLNHMVVAFGIVYLFQIEFVARRARDSSIMRRQTIPVAPGTTPLLTRIFLCRRWGFRRTAECRPELSTRADVELAVDAAEVLLDGLDGHEQRLGDLLVAQLFRGHVRDPPLARREFVEAAEQDRAAMRAGRREFVVASCDQRGRAALMRELDSLAQKLPRFTAAVAATQSGAEIDERTRVLEPRWRARQHLDGLPQPLFSASAALDEAERAQRDADRTLGAPAPREIEFFARELPRLVLASELA